MSSLVGLNIHASQFPANVRRDLQESLRTRQVNHKFHYDSLKQTARWLALHQAYSPSRTDPDCAATYDRAFDQAVVSISADEVHVIGLGCGGGQKDTRLLKLLQAAGRNVLYTPCDVSASMVLEARRHALASLPELDSRPLVCDLSQVEDLCSMLNEHFRERPSSAKAARLFTFFGMIPNFEPGEILHQLSGVVGPSDYLLLSANLAPGEDYLAGIARVMPFYDNVMTRDWLLTFLLDLGVEKGDGEVEFRIEEDSGNVGLRRIAAYFRFDRPRDLRVDAEPFHFGAGENIRLFFSYRYTPALLEQLLRREEMDVRQQWITNSAEEGVFLIAPLPR